VEIRDSKGTTYKQTWEKNMSVKNLPEVTNPDTKTKTEPYIKVSFIPDFSKFSSEGFSSEEGFLDLIKRRIYDLSACNPKLKVFLNGTRVEIYHFKDYVKLFYLNRDLSQISEENPETDVNTETPISEDQNQMNHPERQFFYKRIEEGWELAVGTAIGEEFSQLSFVNSIATVQGGTHVNYLLYQLSKKISEYITKNYPDLQLTIHPAMVQNHIAIFLNCMIENPTFDSQTKETLTVKQSTFQKVMIPDDFVSHLAAHTPIIQNIISFAQYKQTTRFNKPKRRERSIIIPKLDDANLAGTSRSSECVLILTEGDSAKALAISGLSIIGRECYGVFPLRGKLLNVREASAEQIKNNQEIQNIKKILGLDKVSKHETLEEASNRLRYGKVLIMCDQDHDGSHIKGLIINMIQFFYPELIKNNFIEQFITPIVKVSRGGNVKSFFSLPEFENWKNSLSKDDLDKWSQKYYKGLGTNTSKEAKEYFSNLPKHRIVMNYDDLAAHYVELAFSKGYTDERKIWISGLKEGTFLDTSKGSVSLSDFMNRELILFSNQNNIRAIPSLIDGLKPSQRKILFCCLKRDLKNEIKVAQLAGYVSEHSAYHHGEQSLNSTITSMAQDFVGSNNIPLLYPSGQFGTRLQGGSDAASARYIFTRLNKLTRLIFLKEDDEILDYNEEDGLIIEPKFYVPIIPMILVNGVEGLGTGWSTSIPSFNPLDIIDRLNTLLDSDDIASVKLAPLNVWARGFNGDVVYNEETGKFMTKGKYTIVKKSSELFEIQISELPVGEWTDNYKEHLQSLAEKQVIRSKIIESNTESSVGFKIHVENMNSITQTFLKKLKLEKTISLNNMNLFTENLEIARFNTVEDIIKRFFVVRLTYYDKRKEHLIGQFNKQIHILENKLKFLTFITQSETNLQSFMKVKRDGLISFMTQVMGIQQDGNESLNYLTDMSLLSLTTENVQKLTKQLEGVRTEKEQTINTPPKQMWKQDLKRLKEALGTHTDWTK